MQLGLLHLDDALKRQAGFMQTCQGFGARQLALAEPAAAIRLWGKEPALERLQAALRPAVSAMEQPILFMGSGDFHHVTALILPLVLEKVTGPVTVIHFDNHPDWVKFANGLHCGSWVNRALALPKVQKLITIGVCSSDLTRPEWKGANLNLLAEQKLELYPYQHQPSRVRKDYRSGTGYHQDGRTLIWEQMKDMAEEAFIAKLLSRIPTEQIYITIDKDVLLPEDAETNWDQGQIRLPFLLAMVSALGQTHHIVAADVTGDYSTPYYTGSALTRLMKRGEIMLDQPRRKRRKQEIEAVNSASNHAILDVLAKVMA